MIDRYGPPHAPLVVLVHGAVVNRAAMAPLAHALAGRFAVIVPDLPGHGSRRDERYTSARALHDLASLVMSAVDVPIVVAGDSLGGYLALALARRCAGRIAAVVAGGCTFPMRGVAAAAAYLTDLPVRAAAAIAGQERVETLLLRAFVAAGGDRGSAVRIESVGLRLAARRESIAELARFDLAAEIRAVRCPITFVNGALDVPIVSFARRYARLARQGCALTIARSGHGVMALRPEPVAACIARAFETTREKS